MKTLLKDTSLRRGPEREYDEQFQFKITRMDRKQLQWIAATQDRSMSDVVRTAIHDYFIAHERKLRGE